MGLSVIQQTFSYILRNEDGIFIVMAIIINDYEII